MSGEPMLLVEGVAKRFTLHTQGGLELPVLRGLTLTLHRGECVALNSPSGSGKSTLLRLVYGNYRGQDGRIAVRQGGDWVELIGADPRMVMALRRATIGYVSQFLRVVPRVPTLDIVAEPLIATGVAVEKAREAAGKLLARLNIPARLWDVSPVTFSGGEQQRVNIARGFIVDYPVLLLDEPTTSLDTANGAVVMDLIREARGRGAAILAIFHDPEQRAAIADRVLELQPYSAAA